MDINCDWECLAQRETFKIETYILTVACSHDGKYIACAGGDNIFHIYDTQSFKLVHKLIGHSDTIKSICYSPNDRFIVSGGADHTIRLWETDSGQQIGDPFTRYDDIVSSLCFSPDGQFIAYCSYDGALRIQNIFNISSSKSFKGHIGAALSVDYSLHGRIIISGGSDDAVRVWNVDDTRQIKILLTKRHSVTYSVQFGQNSKTFASAHGNNIIRIWDLCHGKQLNRLCGHTAIVSTLSFSPDGRFLASGSNDRTIRIWDISNKESKILKPHLMGVYSVKFSTNGRYIISGSDDNRVKIQHSNI